MARVPYVKPHLTVEQQLDLLESRGMAILDRDRAARCLARFGYYRLTGYWYPQRDAVMKASPTGAVSFDVLDQFRAGTEFSQGVDLCVFDKKLRLLMLDAIERIEVALRVDIAHLIGARDPWAHLKAAELHGNFATKIDPATGGTGHGRWLVRLEELENRSKEDYVKHFGAKYDSPLPVWISIELWELGMLSVFFDGMIHSDKVSIANKYGVPRPELLASWARALNHIRNICAHHSRLWNRSPADQPKVPRPGEIPVLDHLQADAFAQTRLYAVAAVAQFLLRTMYPESKWRERLRDHLVTFPNGPGFAVGNTGFPPGWDALPLWT